MQATTNALTASLDLLNLGKLEVQGSNLGSIDSGRGTSVTSVSSGSGGVLDNS